MPGVKNWSNHTSLSREKNVKTISGQPGKVLNCDRLIFNKGERFGFYHARHLLEPV